MTASHFLMSAAELAAELVPPVDESTVRRRAKAGEIPSHPIGKNGVVFMRDELIEAGVLPKPDDEGPALAEGGADA